MRFAKNIVAVNLFCITADLCQEENFISVTAVSQGWYQRILQSGLEHWGMGFAKNSAAVHWIRSLQTCMNSKPSQL